MSAGALDWAILLAVYTALVVGAILTRRYMRSVADFLAAGRTAGRYMLTIGQGMAALGAITLVANFEMNLEAGFSMSWWGMSMGPFLTILAVSVGLTFLASAPINAVAHRVYDRLRGFLLPFQTPERVPSEAPVSAGDAEVVIFGMGRIGTGAYDALRDELEERLIGVDNDSPTVERQVAEGRNVIQGDPTDLDFWERLVLEGVAAEIEIRLDPEIRRDLVLTQIREFRCFA